MSYNTRDDNQTGPPAEGMNEQARRSARLLALDVLRGLAILVMLLVNNFGSSSQTPGQLQHSAWGESIHLADMAFPWFLFCVGVAIPFSAMSARRRGLHWWQHDLRVLRRTIILILLGTLVNSIGDMKFTPFSVSILETIALSYFTGAMLYGLPIHRRMFFAAAMLVLYWAAIRFLPIPGAVPGTFKETSNFILHLNRDYLGQFGLWNLPRIVPTSALVLIGTAFGDLVRTDDPIPTRRVRALMVSGVVLTILGFLWNIDLPFNKWVWTPPYILLSAGTATFLLGLFYEIVDVRGLRKWAYPLIVFGSNAILIYVLPIVVKGLVLSPLGADVSGWLKVIVFILFWWVVAWLLYRKRWFLRV